MTPWSRKSYNWPGQNRIDAIHLRRWLRGRRNQTKGSGYVCFVCWGGFPEADVVELKVGSVSRFACHGCWADMPKDAVAFG